MTPTLIDQLKLAIQVESGEIEWKEVQLREKTKGAPWNDIQSPPIWNYPHYEYRRKPKPLECWVNTGVWAMEKCVFGSFKEAADWAEMHNRNVHETGIGHLTERVAVHMREVTNE